MSNDRPKQDPTKVGYQDIACYVPDYVWEMPEFKKLPAEVQENLRHLKAVVSIPPPQEQEVDPGNLTAQSGVRWDPNRPVNPTIPLTQLAISVAGKIRMNDKVPVEAGGFIDNVLHTNEYLTEQHIMKNAKGEAISLGSKFTFIPISAWEIRYLATEKDGAKTFCKSTITPNYPDITPEWGKGIPRFSCKTCPFFRWSAGCKTSVRLMGIGFDFKRLYTFNGKGASFVCAQYWGKDGLKKLINSTNPMYRKTLIFEVVQKERQKDGQTQTWTMSELSSTRETNKALQEICKSVADIVYAFHEKRIEYDKAGIARELTQADSLPTPADNVPDWDSIE